MKLLKLRVNNWFSYKNAELNLDKQGVVLVSAPNGYGKSCIFSDAIPWCLFGQTIREKVFDKTSPEFKVDDVVNNRVKKNCSVSLDFIGIDGQKYTVGRFRKDSTYGNSVVITNSEGTDLTGETAKETNEKICSLTGMTYDTYCNSVVFAQGAVRRFTQCTDAQRREIFEDFFDLTVFNVARDMVIADRKEIQKDMAELKHSEENQQSLFESANSRISRYRRSQEESQKALDRLDESVSTEVQKISRVEALRKTTIQSVRKLNAQSDELQKSAMSREDLRELRKKLQATTIEHQQQLRTYYDLDGAIKADNKKISKFSVGSQCPECLREMSSSDLKTYTEILTKRVDVNTTVRKGVELKLKELTKQQQQLQNKLDAQEELESKISQLNSEISNLTRKYTEYTEQLEKLKSVTQSVETSRAKYKAEISNFKKSVEHEQKELETIQAAIQELEEKITGCEEALTVLDFWADGFSNYGIKDLCYSRLVGILNNKLLEYSQRLTGGDIEILFEKDSKDKLKVNVNCRNGASKYVMSSNGQERRVDLCIAMAFQSIVESGAQPVNLSIIDEFDAGLDSEGLTHLEQYIKDEARRKGSIFLITHNPQLAGQFDNVLQIGRDKHGYSTIG